MKKMFTLVFIGCAALAAVHCSRHVTGGSPEDGGLFSGATDYTGPYPAPTSIVFSDNGAISRVMAFPGQALIFFNTPQSDTIASGIITADGGTVLAKIPKLGFYLVEVTSGTDSAFIAAMRGEPNVCWAVPHVVAFPRTGALILDLCGDEHGDSVQAVFARYGGKGAACTDVSTKVGGQVFFNNWKTISGIFHAVNNNPGGSILINCSSSGGLDYEDWALATPDKKKQGLDSWFNDMGVLLQALSILQPSQRANLVITIAAGNEDMPIDSLLNVLRQDYAQFADILTNNVLIVTTSMKVGADSLRANYAGNDPDVAVRNNREAAMGTSLAAPSALAVIQKIVDSLHVSAALALKGVKLAVSRNANHEFIQSEAFTYVQGIRDGTIDTTVVNRQGTYSSTFTDPISVTTSLCSWTGSITATFSVTITGGDGSSSSPYTGTMSLAGTVSTQVTQGGDNCADYSGQVTQSGTVSGTDPTVSGSVTSGLAMAFNGTFSSDGLTGTVTLNSPGYWLVPVVLNVNLLK